MTTLIERAKQIGALSIRVGKIEIERHQAAVWFQGETTIDRLHAEISEIREFMKWMDGKTTGLSVAPPRGQTRVNNAIAKYLKYLSENPDADKAQEQIAKLVEPSREAIKSQTNDAQTLWKKYAESIKWENPDIYAAFKNDDTHGKSVQELAEATRAYQGLVSEYFLRRKEQRVEFDELLETHAQLIRTLPAMDDAEVRTFLVDAASAVGAPLGNLTENVLTWLKDHKLTAKYSARRRDS